MDWMLEATLTESAADEKGLAEVAKLYEETSLMTAMADFEAVLRVDMGVTETMVTRIEVKALHCESCEGRLPDPQKMRCESCSK